MPRYAGWKGKIRVLGDDLYCHEPFFRALLDKRFKFIQVCKPDSHKTLYEWVDNLDRNGVVKTVMHKWTGKHDEIDTYRYVSAVPLRDTDDALLVNGCEITTRAEDGKVLYRNVFAISLAVNNDKVAEVITSGGRGKRLKIKTIIR